MNKGTNNIVAEKTLFEIITKSLLLEPQISATIYSNGRTPICAEAVKVQVFL